MGGRPGPADRRSRRASTGPGSPAVSAARVPGPVNVVTPRLRRRRALDGVARDMRRARRDVNRPRGPDLKPVDPRVAGLGSRQGHVLAEGWPPHRTSSARRPTAPEAGSFPWAGGPSQRVDPGWSMNLAVACRGQRSGRPIDALRSFPDRYSKSSRKSARRGQVDKQGEAAGYPWLSWSRL